MLVALLIAISTSQPVPVPDAALKMNLSIEKCEITKPNPYSYTGSCDNDKYTWKCSCFPLQGVCYCEDQYQNTWCEPS